VDQVARDIPDAALQLIDRFWPGPLTLVLPRTSAVPDLVTAGLDTVGVRLPDHDQARELMRAVGRPLAAPSANPFGGISPTTAAHVREGLGNVIDFILDGGPCATGIESTIVGFDDDGRCRLFRPGGIALDAIAEVVGDVVPMPSVLPIIESAANSAETHEVNADGNSSASLPAPGMMARHYAPRTPLVLLDDLDEQAVSQVLMRDGSGEFGLLGFDSLAVTKLTPDARHVEVLSTSGDLHEAAANLFASLRRLDAAGCDVIVAQRVPDTGLGLAINDRLHRASQPAV